MNLRTPGGGLLPGEPAGEPAVEPAVEPQGIDADAIDETFVPHARPDVASVLVGTEIVLGRVPAGVRYVQTCALNESGSLVWQCFDGTGTIADIAADIADVYEADLEAVTADVCALARTVGAIGLLHGVRASVLELDDEPVGIAIGAPFPAFDARHESGSAWSIDQLVGRRTLIVNWSPTCQFCGRIAADLAALTPRLANAGIDMVLLATGTARVNRELLDGSRFTGELLLQDADRAPGFDGMGTPVAYVLDEQGRVAEPVALGSNEVLDLARRAATDPAGR